MHRIPDVTNPGHEMEVEAIHRIRVTVELTLCPYDMDEAIRNLAERHGIAMDDILPPDAFYLALAEMLRKKFNFPYADLEVAKRAWFAWNVAASEPDFSRAETAAQVLGEVQLVLGVDHRTLTEAPAEAP